MISLGPKDLQYPHRRSGIPAMKLAGNSQQWSLARWTTKSRSKDKSFVRMFRRILLGTWHGPGLFWYDTSSV